MRSRSEWISEIDRYVHRFTILYKTRFEGSHKAPLKDLTPLELGILNLIEWDPQVSLKDIVAYLNAPNSTVTSAVNRLERRGVLVRSIHPQDRRSFTLRFTEAGQELMQYRAEAKELMFGALYRALENDEGRETLLVLLERVFDNLSAADADR